MGWLVSSGWSVVFLQACRCAARGGMRCSSVRGHVLQQTTEAPWGLLELVPVLCYLVSVQTVWGVCCTRWPLESCACCVCYSRLRRGSSSSTLASALYEQQRWMHRQKSDTGLHAGGYEGCVCVLGCWRCLLRRSSSRTSALICSLRQPCVCALCCSFVCAAQLCTLQRHACRFFVMNTLCSGCVRVRLQHPSCAILCARVHSAARFSPCLRCQRRPCLSSSC
jgi:hypothetical protein